MRVDYIRQGDESLALITGVQPGQIWMAGEQLLLYSSLRVEYRDYHESDDLDALYAEWLQGVRSHWGRNREVGSALALFTEDAENDANSNDGGEISATLVQHWPDVLDLMVYGRVRLEWYDEREPLAPEDRRDQEFDIGLELQRALTPHLGLFAGYQFTQNRSTFDLYDYDRNYWTAGVQGGW